MYWHISRDEFDDKLMKELKNQFKNYTLDELMNALKEIEEMTTMYNKKDESELQINNDKHVTNDDTSDCDDSCEHCKFNEQHPIEFDMQMHDPFIDMTNDYLDDKPEDEYDAYNQGKHDAVNHPSYYCGNIEVIDFIEDKNLGYHLGNAVKYISRAGKKHEIGMSDLEKKIEDLKKARFYLNRKIKLLEEECK